MTEQKFAWLPTRMTSGKLIWLQSYNLNRSMYDESTGRPPLHSQHFEFTETAKEQTWRLLTEQRIDNNRNVWNTPKGN
jgi:hypothetical protein